MSDRPKRLRVEAGWGCRRPLIGVEVAPFANGCLFRLSLWPNRYGFHVVWWRE